jgi:hypothetical protein
LKGKEEIRMNEKSVRDSEEVKVPDWIKFVNEVLDKKATEEEKKSTKMRVSLACEPKSKK